jgi:hypothetical protein
MRKSLRAGLVLAVLLGLADLALPLGGGDVPPMPIAIGGAVLGLITIVAAIFAWRGSRAGVVTVVVARTLSALSAVPAFFAPDVPGAAQIAAAVIVALTLVVFGLVMPGLRRPMPA